MMWSSAMVDLLIRIQTKIILHFFMFIQISMNFGNLYEFLEIFNRIMKMEKD
jgi:hypothetical protein